MYYKGLFEKNNTYMNKIRSESFNRVEDYLEIEKVIQINIDNFTHYKGDKIIYETKYTTKTFIVNEIKEIQETDLSVLNPSENNIITLITCVKNKSNLRLCVIGVEE